MALVRILPLLKAFISTNGSLSPAIVSALEHCINNPQDAKEMGERSRQLTFKHYIWEHISLKMIGVIHHHF